MHVCAHPAGGVYQATKVKVDPTVSNLLLETTTKIQWGKNSKSDQTQVTTMVLSESLSTPQYSASFGRDATYTRVRLVLRCDSNRIVKIHSSSR